MKKTLLLTGILAATALNAQILSVNFTESTTNINGTTGVIPVDVSGWTNINGIFSPFATVFQDGSAAATTVDTTLAGGVNRFFGATYASATSQLLNGAITDYVDSGTGLPNGGNTVSFSGLATDFPAGYDVYVYLNGFTGFNGGSVTDGTTTYYWDNHAAHGDFTGYIQVTDTDNSDGYDIGQYVIFSGLTADSLSLSYETLTAGGGGIAGVQIVAVPEPGYFALGGALLALALVVRRRFL